jgi:hypothetical protein
VSWVTVPLRSESALGGNLRRQGTFRFWCIARQTAGARQARGRKPEGQAGMGFCTLSALLSFRIPTVGRHSHCRSSFPTVVRHSRCRSSLGLPLVIPAVVRHWGCPSSFPRQRESRVVKPLDSRFAGMTTVYEQSLGMGSEEPSARRRTVCHDQRFEPARVFRCRSSFPTVVRHWGCPSSFPR